MLLLASAGGGPSIYWFATRGLGTASLILLTSTVVLGIGTVGRWREEVTPGFVVANLHRNLSLLAIMTVIAHITTTILDPYAHITIRDAIVPIDAKYRPLWLGLGVVAFEILLAIIATSLLRSFIGVRMWRAIHWTAYGSWPLAVVHGLGTGSDAQAAWLIGVVAACMVGVGLALARRLLAARSTAFSAAAAVVVGGLSYACVTWYLGGPLQSNWAIRAGTPPAPPTSPGPLHTGPGGFSDMLVGVMSRDDSGNVQISFRDSIDTELTILIRSRNANETLPVVTVQRKGRQLCSMPASVDTAIYAVCGKTRLTITLYEPISKDIGTSTITGRLDTSGPLN